MFLGMPVSPYIYHFMLCVNFLFHALQLQGIIQVHKPLILLKLKGYDYPCNEVIQFNGPYFYAHIPEAIPFKHTDS